MENAASRYEDAMACGEHEHGPGRELVHHAELLLYLCSICKLVLNDPVQIIACGHRFCKSCLKKFTAESSRCMALQRNLLKFRKFSLCTINLLRLSSSNIELSCIVSLAFMQLSLSCRNVQCAVWKISGNLAH